jgi:hypothetical protein
MSRHGPPCASNHSSTPMAAASSRTLQDSEPCARALCHGGESTASVSVPSRGGQLRHYAQRFAHLRRPPHTKRGGWHRDCWRRRLVPRPPVDLTLPRLGYQPGHQRSRRDPDPQTLAAPASIPDLSPRPWWCHSAPGVTSRNCPDPGSVQQRRCGRSIRPRSRVTGNRR